jgi:hypothetical protein
VARSKPLRPCEVLPTELVFPHKKQRKHNDKHEEAVRNDLSRRLSYPVSRRQFAYSM